ncbi:Mitogen-activated protein kinase adapter protein MST50 [Neonectria punicea]|uniref:Mitogen-activated protein kinase adapter protein MST50 n=1 Tax=Neonectria punicea TaxID=979145 RepID=A0ABR1GGH9_9HYPO
MMSFDGGTAYAESDADDEYERSMGGHSPVADFETSPIDSELSTSAEHTPTYAHHTNSERLPETIITEWTADECADFIANIGLPQYSDRFIENDIVGEALVALLHDDLKSMGIASVGHRLTILKGVYDVKKAQDVPMESDHYLPLSADAEAQYATATLKDIRHLVEQFRVRDERMIMLEQDLRRMTDDFRRLREDMLPALRLVKDAQQPLPNLSGNTQAYSYEATISPPAPTPTSSQSANAMKRQYSTRKIVIGTTPKNASPTQTTHERSIAETTLDPANAAERAVLSSSHLAAMNGGGQGASSPSYPSPNIPSPTSPPTHMSATTLASRSYRSDAPITSTRTTFDNPDHGTGTYNSSRDKGPQGPPRRRETPVPDTPNSNASVEIFKSFRVSMEDPCYKVLPAALKKYQINAPWDQYALYIVYGDQERCLGLEEKPLILFKQLDKEGKKPMFMLRKTTAAPAEGEPGSAGLGNTGGRGAAAGYDPPGGII